MISYNKKVFVDETEVDSTPAPRCSQEKRKTVKATALSMETGSADGATNRFDG